MTPTEREPFTSEVGPFTSVEGDTSPAPAVKETTHAVYGTKHTVRYKLPSSVIYRIKGIIQAERRTASTVMEKVVEDFLAVPINNPLPYIPLNLYSEDWVVFSWTMPDEQKEKLQARAMAEGRLNDGRCASNILVTRALVDYIAASPDDPMKRMPAVDAADSKEPVYEIVLTSEEEVSEDTDDEWEPLDETESEDDGESEEASE